MECGYPKIIAGSRPVRILLKKVLQYVNLLFLLNLKNIQDMSPQVEENLNIYEIMFTAPPPFSIHSITVLKDLECPFHGRIASPVFPA